MAQISDGSTIASALEASKTKYVPLFTVDLYQPDTKKAANFSIARKSLYDLKLGWCVCQIVYDASSFLQHWNMPIKLAFIDALHDYETVAKQIDLVMRFVVLGGYVVFHDYVEEEWSGIIPAVNEFIDRQSPDTIEVFGISGTVVIKKLGEIHSVYND